MGKVIVTGGSGKLGRACITDLLDHGYDVLNVDTAPPPAMQRGAFVRADLTDFGQTVDVLSGFDEGLGGRGRVADAVVHLAAIPAPSLYPTK